MKHNGLTRSSNKTPIQRVQEFYNRKKKSNFSNIFVTTS